jgi:hypothetical protein
MRNETRDPLLRHRVSMLCVVALFFAVESRAGAPLKGVDVKLGKGAGGGAAARTTGADGAFDFGVMPRGSYFLTLAMTNRGASPGRLPATCVIEIHGAKEGTMKIDWDLDKGRRSFTSVAARRPGEDRIPLSSDGVHPLRGTVVKSKSYISNN